MLGLCLIDEESMFSQIAVESRARAVNNRLGGGVMNLWLLVGRVRRVGFLRGVYFSRWTLLSVFSYLSVDLSSVAV